MLAEMLLATGIGSFGIQDTTPPFRWSEAMPAGSTIEVRGVIGGIRAEPASGREVTVVATRARGRHGIPEDVEIRVFRDSAGANVLICAVYPRGRWDDGGQALPRDPCEAARRRRDERAENDTRVDYLVKVPAGIHFVGRTVTDDVIVTGLRGAAEGYSIAGDVTLRDVKGSVIDAASISGNLRFQQVDAPSVYGGTLSGDISFAGTIHRQGDYDLLSHSGEIAVDVPRGADVSLEVWASGGDLHSVIPLTRRPESRHRFAGKQGDGSAKMSLTSLNGEVHILAPPR